MKVTIADKVITDDSRLCDSSTYFFADHQSRKYLDDVKAKGCAGILYPTDLKTIVGLDSIKAIGVTGTNGKTTTTALIYSLLLDLGYKAALLGTRGFFINEERGADKSLTTPSLLENLHDIYRAKEAGCEYFVMEVSSHGIDQQRIEGIDFALKVHTNITGDHLDYHKTFENYRDVKNSFLADETPKLINKDDPHVDFNYKNAMTYAIEGAGIYRIEAYSLNHNHLTGIVKSVDGRAVFQSPLMGTFNLYNILAAIGSVHMLTKLPLEDICDKVENFGGVEGRMEVINGKPLIIVDFAHTHDGIEKALESLESKNIIALFGAGGDRDKTKRPKMGFAAAKKAKHIYLTSDNPRHEEPMAIIEDILAGIDQKDKVTIEPDREKAIALALKNLNENEVLLVLGKGDEKIQEIGDSIHPFSDKAIILKYLNQKD